MLEFNTGKFLPDLKKRQDEIGESLSPEAFIELIKDLPDYWMEHQHGIRIDFSSQNQDSKLFNLIRKEYRNKGKWFELDILNRREILLELTNTEAHHYKFFSERTLSFKQLASDICSYKGSWAQEQKIDPLLWTVYIEAQLCEISLRNSGYITESASLTGTGKNALYSWGLERYEWFQDNIERLRFDIGGDSPKGALEKHGAWIAKSDMEFRYTSFADYLKGQRRYFRRLKNSKFNGLYLGADGNVHSISRGRDTRFARKKGGKGRSDILGFNAQL